MVLLRAATWVWLGALPVVWCLPLEGVIRNAPHQHQQQQPPQQPLSILEDLSAGHNLPPQDYAQDDYQTLLTRRPEVAPVASFNSYDGSEGTPYAYRLPEGMSGADLPAANGYATDIAVLEYLLSQYHDHQEDPSGSDDDITANSMNAVRKVRNSASLSNDNSNSNLDISSSNNNSNSKAKRAWPHGFSRRRTSGLSLSIDASMKVLREALYLEMARKKQRQQMQRARHNQALLTSIGKRDVQQQLLLQQEEEGNNNRPDQDYLHAQRN